MKARWTCGIIILCLGGWAQGSMAGGRTLTSAALPAPAEIPFWSGEVDIQVDGELTEPAWRSAGRIRGLTLSDGSEPESEPTEILFGYDREAFYIGWVMDDRDVRATLRERDSRFWEEEVVEIFVTASGLNEYYELQWNPLGGIFDAVIRNSLESDGRSSGIEGEWDWTAEGMESAVKLQGTPMDSDDVDTGWSVEARIPFKALGVARPAGGDVWQANFFRMNRDGERETEGLAWSPVYLPSFHQPLRFGYLIFGSPDNGGKRSDEE